MKENTGAKEMSSAYIRMREVRGQVPGTTRYEVRTKSATNNYQAPHYIRAEREWRAGVSSGPPEWNTRRTWNTRVEPPSRRGPVSRGPRPSTTPLSGVTTDYYKTMSYQCQFVCSNRYITRVWLSVISSRQMSNFVDIY